MGEPEGAVHPQPEGLGPQLREPGREGGRDERAQDGDADGQPDPAEGEVVRLLRVHPFEDQTEEKLVHLSVLTRRGTPFPVSPSRLLVAGRGQVFGVFLE